MVSGGRTRTLVEMVDKMVDYILPGFVLPVPVLPVLVTTGVWSLVFGNLEISAAVAAGMVTLFVVMSLWLAVYSAYVTWGWCTFGTRKVMWKYIITVWFLFAIVGVGVVGSAFFAADTRIYSTGCSAFGLFYVVATVLLVVICIVYLLDIIGSFDLLGISFGLIGLVGGLGLVACFAVDMRVCSTVFSSFGLVNFWLAFLWWLLWVDDERREQEGMKDFIIGSLVVIFMIMSCGFGSYFAPMRQNVVCIVTAVAVLWALYSSDQVIPHGGRFLTAVVYPVLSFLLAMGVISIWGPFNHFAERRQAREMAKVMAREKEVAWQAYQKEESRKAGMTKTITLPGGAEMEMIYCPPGEFMMGSPGSEKGRSNTETQHRVRLTKGFWLGKYPVTQRQWKSVMGSNPSEFKGDDCPVEMVSWEDCQEFTKKVNAALGCGARLPTEAEWEYACRAGTTGAYGGTGNLDEMGWFGDNGGYTTHPVGQKKPNSWGLCDMHGNVWEWCADWDGDYPTGSVSDPQGPASGGGRVLRGGGWRNRARFCRSAFRDWVIPGYRNYCYGFRLCCSVGPRGPGAEREKSVVILGNDK